MELATLASGCFWCTEAVFQRLKGVEKVTPGYTGGTTSNPSYEEVCSGKTGHVEAIQIEFNPSVISYKQLLEVFFALHDPTTLNRQGNDVGTQYASKIFYHNSEQEHTAMIVLDQLKSKYQDQIMTKLEAFKQFYPAESYHIDYYETHKDQPYCQIIIDPKIQKLYRDFKEISK